MNTSAEYTQEASPSFKCFDLLDFDYTDLGESRLLFGNQLAFFSKPHRFRIPCAVIPGKNRELLPPCGVDRLTLRSGTQEQHFILDPCTIPGRRFWVCWIPSCSQMRIIDEPLGLYLNKHGVATRRSMLHAPLGIYESLDDALIGRFDMMERLRDSELLQRSK